jgi:hypothetical protein
MALFSAMLISSESVAVLPLAMTLLVVNGALSIYGQVKSISTLSPLHYISFLFCYLFMSLMPILQIGYRIDPVFNFHEVVLLSAIAGLIFTVFGLWSLHRLARSVTVMQRMQAAQLPKEDKNPNYFLLAGLVLLFSVATFAIFKKSLFTSRETFLLAVAGTFGDKTIGSAISNFIMIAHCSSQAQLVLGDGIRNFVGRFTRYQ